MGVAAVFAKRVREKRRAGVVRKSGESGWASFCGVCVCAVGDLVRETNEHGGYGRLVVMVLVLVRWVWCKASRKRARRAPR